MHRSVLALLLLAGLVVASAVHAEGTPFVGVDLGVAAPTGDHYNALVSLGGAGNPFAGYMFNQYIGLQGQLQFAAQSPNNPVPGTTQQTTTIFGGGVGPRLQLPLDKFLDVYVTGQGGYFTGLSGVLTHSAPGFSVGGGIEYSINPQIAVGLSGRYNRAYMSARPNALPGRSDSVQGPQDTQWMTAGVGIKYSFVTPEAPPPPPPPPPVVAQAPPPPVKKKIVLRSVHFDFNKSNIRPDAVPVLDEAAKILKDDPTVPVVVAGHTDSIGSDAYNMKLSQRRADAVKDYLVSHGVDASRIRAEGFGKGQPVASNDTADGRAQTRRVELHDE